MKIQGACHARQICGQAEKESLPIFPVGGAKGPTVPSLRKHHSVVRSSSQERMVRGDGVI